MKKMSDQIIQISDRARLEPLEQVTCKNNISLVTTAMIHHNSVYL